ncbi:MAG: hypothetical protein IT285_15015 [Bdellovibrionales bacterium]|nr:hypothetical protein [Bdellovibrionales bacterium]
MRFDRLIGRVPPLLRFVLAFGAVVAFGVFVLEPYLGEWEWINTTGHRGWRREGLAPMVALPMALLAGVWAVGRFGPAGLREAGQSLAKRSKAEERAAKTQGAGFLPFGCMGPFFALLLAGLLMPFLAPLLDARGLEVRRNMLWTVALFAPTVVLTLQLVRVAYWIWRRWLRSKALAQASPTVDRPDR